MNANEDRSLQAVSPAPSGARPGSAANNQPLLLIRVLRVLRVLRGLIGLFRGAPAAAALAVALLLAACGDPGTGPTEVKWDRATCERCRMVLSDRHHAAQVRARTADGRSRAYQFDDLGCALTWLEPRPSRDDPATEVWVADWRTGAWLPARTAAYVPNQVTPMGYGLGAQPDPGPGTLTFDQASAHVAEVESRLNIHGAHAEPAAMPAPGAH